MRIRDVLIRCCQNKLTRLPQQNIDSPFVMLTSPDCSPRVSDISSRFFNSADHRI